MRSLAELQRSFATFLLSAPDYGPNRALTDAIRPSAIPTRKLLAIYKNNVYARLHDALAASYPAVQRLVGDEFFRFAAREFIASHPAKHAALLTYGDAFPEFIDGFAPAKSVAYLGDVARLEQRYLLAYHAIDAHPISGSDFAALISDSARDPDLTLHPSAQLMTSPFPVSRIWEVNVRDEAITSGTHIPGGAEHLLIVRPTATVEVRRLSRGAFAAITAIRDGHGYAHALACAVAADPDTDTRAHLQSLANGETFCSDARNPR